MPSPLPRQLVQQIESLDTNLLEGDKIQPGHPLFGLVWMNPARVSGAPCFYGTRVPIKALFDSIAAGDCLDDCLDGFDGVSREQACAILELAGSVLLRDLEKL
jgi:uncharacterized protein (DUF433 family)